MPESFPYVFLICVNLRNLRIFLSALRSRPARMIENVIQKLQIGSADIFASYPVLFGYVYGSYATGTAHPFSDLDIGVYIEPEAVERTLEIELDLALALDKHLGHRIETDVRCLNALPLNFVGQILSESILFYSRDENLRIDFEVRTRKKYFDFMPVLQAYHKAYITRPFDRQVGERWLSRKKLSPSLKCSISFLASFDNFRRQKLETYLKDVVLIGSMRYYLQVSIECCLDVAAHVISSERYRAPKDYADTFTVLEENGIIPAELGHRLRQMAKFRNRLVHLYGEIDDQAVYRIAREDLDDIEAFKTAILKTAI